MGKKRERQAKAAPSNAITPIGSKDERIGLADAGALAAAIGRKSHAGKSVTLNAAMQLATVWACIRLTAQAVSALPLGTFRREADGGRTAVDDHALAEVLEVSPNADQTSLEFWEATVAWLISTGNSYAEKVEFGKRLSSLQPLASTHCRPVRLPSGELVYRVTDRGKSEDMPRSKVFHIKGFGFGGDLGLSAIANGAETFGAAMATDEAAGKIFGNGLSVSGILSSEQVLKADQRRDLKNAMLAYAGSTNAGKLMILEAGLKYQQMTLNPEDAQMLETRRFHIEEMCRWFGMPPIIIGHAAQGQTMWGSGVEQILLTWLALGINPICRRIEARIVKDLVPAGEKRRLYCEFNREGLLQMDSAAKATFLSQMTQNGLMDRNEGRAKLNLPRREGADALTAQTNLAPLDQLGATGGDASAARNALAAWLGLSGN
ncbi:phage portal protein [Aureimonas ureilytica]|uniref:phage portal protein n=1 Tax=Aureimonas ureilytica TaxID=401562 RepID=UPI0007349F95|nr:phage portal protein [Aureimonas ureilytica]